MDTEQIDVGKLPLNNETTGFTEVNIRWRPTVKLRTNIYLLITQIIHT